MTTIGIDPSINSTGVCVYEDGKCKYYIITSHKTKKIVNFKHPLITILTYDKEDVKDMDYIDKEKAKTSNLHAICDALTSIIKKHKPDIISMEGVSYGSVGSAALVDLAGLNFMIRERIIMEGIDYQIVSPTQNKKFATGNGSADKDVMIYSWLCIESHLKDIKDIKIDDLADAYFLAHYSMQEIG